MFAQHNHNNFPRFLNKNAKSAQIGYIFRWSWAKTRTIWIHWIWQVCLHINQLSKKLRKNFNKFIVTRLSKPPILTSSGIFSHFGRYSILMNLKFSLHPVHTFQGRRVWLIKRISIFLHFTNVSRSLKCSR